MDMRDSFDLTLQSIPAMTRGVFDTAKQFAIFQKAMEWREDQCQKSDRNKEQFLPLKNLGQIVLALPLKKEFIYTLYSPSKSWEAETISSLLDILGSQRDQNVLATFGSSSRTHGHHNHPELSSNLRDNRRPNLIVVAERQERTVRQVYGRIDGNRILPRRRKNRGRKEKQRSAARALMYKIYKEGL
jgi:hypothetical protein